MRPNGEGEKKTSQEVVDFHVVAHGACAVELRRVRADLRIVIRFMMQFVRSLTSAKGSKAKTGRLIPSRRLAADFHFTPYFPYWKLDKHFF